MEKNDIHNPGQVIQPNTHTPLSTIRNYIHLPWTSDIHNVDHNVICVE
jgi:hypothetical protein